MAESCGENCDSMGCTRSCTLEPYHGGEHNCGGDHAANPDEL
jgi:hypothetical protein